MALANATLTHFFHSYIAGVRRLNLKPEIGGSPPATDLSFSDVDVHIGVLNIQIGRGFVSDLSFLF